MAIAPFQQQFDQVESYGVDVDVDDSYKLPGSRPISKIIIRHTLEDSASNVASSIDLIDVEIAGISLFGRLTGAQLRKLTKLWMGYTPAAPSAALTEVQELVIPFGRFPGDPQWALPADRFNARLIYQASNTNADTQNDVEIFVEQLPIRSGDQPMVTRKVSQPDDVTPSAGTDWKLEGNAGERLAALYLDYNDVDNVDGARLQLGFNNRQETPYDLSREALEEFMLTTYNLRDDTLPTTFLAFPLDRAGSFEAAIPTGKQSNQRDFAIEGTAASSGVSGDIELLQEAYARLG